MNRLVLIGNGFDLAHGLKTSYADFIDWYWDKSALAICCIYAKEYSDELMSVKYKGDGYIYTHFYGNTNPNFRKESGYGKYVIEELVNRPYFETTFSPLFERITKCIETKGWVDIENEYYKLLTEYALPVVYQPFKKEGVKELNEQLHYLQELLVEYLTEITKQETNFHRYIKHLIYAPINSEDIAVEGKERWLDYVKSEMDKDEKALDYKRTDYGIRNNGCIYEISDFKNHPWDLKTKDYPDLARLPEHIMLLNFNYTNTPEKYLNREVATIVPIHGELDKPESVIFGYGDEIDSSFKELRDLKNGECLKNVKSMRYLEAPNYRNVLSFIESAPFQVLIMGHSCGNSDRTLLNTIFEHKNCISIKPYFYQKEDGSNNYIELIQNISRNFNDMKLMRDRVVNKMQCEPLPQIKKQE